MWRNPRLPGIERCTLIAFNLLHFTNPVIYQKMKATDDKLNV